MSKTTDDRDKNLIKLAEYDDAKDCAYRWVDDKDGDVVEVDCDCGQEHEAVVRGEVGQLLEWFCPIEGKLKRDVNA